MRAWVAVGRFSGHRERSPRTKGRGEIPSTTGRARGRERVLRYDSNFESRGEYSGENNVGGSEGARAIFQGSEHVSRYTKMTPQDHRSLDRPSKSRVSKHSGAIYG